ncbi:MAG: hypothetical protein NZ828_05935 [Alphaproteobacteria bacterium]|nr:hypothetical protein [Alphaproteobacteria bacterium]
MIKSAWGVYLAIVTLLGGLITVAPVFAVFTILFWPLFFILAFMPTIALYSWALTLSFFLFQRLGKQKYVAAPALVVILALAIPYVFNARIDRHINALTKDDINIETPLPSGGTLKFEIPGSYGNNQHTCDSLCQNLLYNKAYEQIIINYHDRGTYNFHLENRTSCPPLKNILDGTAARIANGECLIQTKGNTNTADFIYRKERISTAERNLKFKIHAITVRADRVTVLDNRTTDKKTLYQKTQIQARPLAYPFMVGLGGGYQLDFHSEILRTKKNLNTLSKDDIYKIFKATALKDIKTNAENKIRIISNYLDNKHEPNLAAEQLLESFWRDLERKDTYSPDEIHIIIRAVQDERVKFSYELPKVIKKLGDIPDELVVALGNRAIQKPSNIISNAIMALPDGRADIIAPQLEQLAQNKALRATNNMAIARLGDGSDNAVYLYMNLLKDYKAFLNSGNALDDIRKKEERAVLGAIIGLCRLEVKAAPAKEDLYSIFENNKTRRQIRTTIARALIQIADINELEQKYLNSEQYKNTDRIRVELRNAINNRARKTANHKSPC